MALDHLAVAVQQDLGELYRDMAQVHSEKEAIRTDTLQRDWLRLHLICRLLLPQLPHRFHSHEFPTRLPCDLLGRRNQESVPVYLRHQQDSQGVYQDDTEGGQLHLETRLAF